MRRTPYYINNLLLILFLIWIILAGFGEDSYVALLVGEFVVGAFQMIVSLIFFVSLKPNENPFFRHFIISILYLGGLYMAGQLNWHFDDKAELIFIVICPWLLAAYFTLSYHRALNKSE